MEFLEAGEKIRRIRRSLDMSQMDFQDESMTRSYFGMIENGKRNINADIAKRIVAKFMTRAEELGVNINITVEELLRTPQEDADNYCTTLLNNNPSSEAIKNIMIIAKKYKLSKVMADAHRLYGDNLYENGEYQSAFGEYSKALDGYINISLKDKQPYLYNRLGLCKYFLLDYEDAALYFDRAYYNSIAYSSKESEKEALYNLALGHKKLQKYKEALGFIDEYIEKFHKDGHDLEDYVNIVVLKANCWVDQKEIDKAMEEYKSILNVIPNTACALEAYVSHSMAMAYLENNDLDKANEFINRSIELSELHDKKSLSHSMIGKSEILVKQGKLGEAADFVKKGIEFAENYKNLEHLIKGYDILAKVYEALGDNEAAEYTLLKRLSVIGKKNNFILIETYIMLQKLYLKLQRYGDLAKLIESTESSVNKYYSNSGPFNKSM